MAMYIHEQSEWSRLTWRMEALATGLAGVRHGQGRLLGRMESVGLASRAAAELQTLTAEVQKTSEIEGEHLEERQVRSSIARRLGMDIGALVPADRHVEGVVEMMLDATRKYAEPLSAERLFGWHAALFPEGQSGMAAIPVGRWRDDATGAMRVVSGRMGRERVHFEAPAAGRLDGEMARFIGWFNSEEDVDLVLRAGVAHFWFVTIHPFADGNGRMARALGDLLLARSEKSAQRFYSLSAQVMLERNAYYDALEAAQKGGVDITGWLVWYLGCLDRALVGAEGMLGAVLVKARFWERHAGESLNARQREVVNRLLDGFEGKLTTSKWARLCKCSTDTALRDVDDLVRRGVLKKDAPGGRSTNYLLVGDGEGK